MVVMTRLILVACLLLSGCYPAAEVAPAGCDVRDQILADIERLREDYTPDHVVTVVRDYRHGIAKTTHSINVAVCDVVALDFYIDLDGLHRFESELYNTAERISAGVLEPISKQRIDFWERTPEPETFQITTITREMYLVHSNNPISFEIAREWRSTIALPDEVLSSIELLPE